MGYQESYIRVNNQKDFDKLVKFIQDIGEEYYYSIGAFPTDVITFTKKHEIFKKGDKVIYFCGERYPQTHLLCNYDKDDDYGVLPNCQIPLTRIFTEDIDPKGIWEDSGEITDCIHERFNFTE